MLSYYFLTMLKTFTLNSIVITVILFIIVILFTVKKFNIANQLAILLVNFL